MRAWERGGSIVSEAEGLVMLNANVDVGCFSVRG